MLDTKWNLAGVYVALGGIGLAVHLVFLRWSVFRPMPGDRSGLFINNFFVSMTLGLLGGLFYALFLRWPVIECLRTRSISLSALLKGGFWGMVATFAALQGRYLAAACFLTWKMKTDVPEGSLKTAFLLAIMEIETYGLIEICYVLIPALACGALVTGMVAKVSLFTKRSATAVRS